MALNSNNNSPLRATKSPNLPIGPVDYDQRFQDQFSNALRLYFNQIDNFTQAVVNPNFGSTANRPISTEQAPLPIGSLYFDTDVSTLFLWDGSNWVPATPASSSPVTSFSAGSTGLTPNSPTTGPVTLSGTLGIGNGGTNATTANQARINLGISEVIAGTISMWPTASAPTGYLLCNGASVATATYPTLFAVIGYTFGGSGSSFLLPNYTNRMPYGTTIGATGGTADAIVVSHTHTATVTDPGHLHTVNLAVVVSSSDTINGSGGFPRGAGTTSTATTGISVANSTTGVSGTNANLPPYLGINFIIKT